MYSKIRQHVTCTSTTPLSHFSGQSNSKQQYFTLFSLWKVSISIIQHSRDRKICLQYSLCPMHLLSIAELCMAFFKDVVEPVPYNLTFYLPERKG